MESVPGHNKNNTFNRQIKIIFQTRKGSTNIRLKEMDKFLQAELEVGRQKMLDMERSLLKNLIKNIREALLQSVLHLSI